jgi:hypothetical protein
MVASHQIAATRLVESLTSRGIAIEVENDRLMISPASRLTDRDQAGIRSHKAELIGLLSPCVSHVDSAGWIREPVPDRPGWERASCLRCGRSIGFNPIRGPDGRVQKLAGVTVD